MEFDSRKAELEQWLKSTLDLPAIELSPLTGDASFRRYFRLQLPDESYIVMDAPPGLEDVAVFVQRAEYFAANGILVPQVYFQDSQQGFVLLSDFGDELYSTQVNEANADDFYHRAIDVLLKIQQSQTVTGSSLPTFDAEFMQTEMQLFIDWFLPSIDIQLDDEKLAMLTACFSQIIQQAEKQPQCCIHRDYHSRNLMILSDAQLGVLDFQDAMLGPITYDLVSLLRDCYIEWPEARVIAWLEYYYQAAKIQGILSEEVDWSTFVRWFDYVGMQRHFKVVGIFSRLAQRDGKRAYLQDRPLALRYLMAELNKYPEFAVVTDWLKTTVMPKVVVCEQ